MNKINVGDKFNRLTVIEKTEKRASNGSIIYKCKCDCGNISFVASSPLKNGRVKSCGCYMKERLKESHVKDLTGQRFGHWICLYRTENLGDAETYKWMCKCDCGTIKEVSMHSLTSGRSSSCGCIKSKGEEKIASLLQNMDITFEREKTFEDCLSEKKYKLKFDFYLPKYNCCIEYQGMQHFTTGSGWNNQQHLEKLIKNDAIKKQYCQNNNIKLIEIFYKDFNKIDKFYLKERIGDL